MSDLASQVASETRAGPATTAAAEVTLVDCDLHNTVPGIDALYPYMAAHWVVYCRESAFKGPTDSAYPPGAPTTVAPLWRPGEGGQAGTTVGSLRQQLLDPLGVGLGILTCVYGVESVHNPDTAAQVASAVNDWQVAEWLDPEPRLRASIVVPSQHPEMAAREIERRAGDRRFVQVLLPVRSAAPYGNRNYHPIFAAAERHGLAVALHFGGAPGNPPTSSGWPSFYWEEYAGMAQVFQTQVLSLVAEGVFDRFPELRVACVEGGFSWLPALFWRFDKVWKGLRRDVPWVRRPPSEYVRERMRFTIQPLDVPPGPSGLTDVIEDLGSDDLLLFASDYPHWHFDALEDAIPAALPDRIRQAVLVENARAFYRL
ncbi:MAG: amidohydrolase family protein [Candidatus Dormiibacterota bacterium]